MRRLKQYERRRDPDPGEIARRTAEIRSRWTAREWEQRRCFLEGDVPPWTVPEVSIRRMDGRRGVMESEDQDNPE
jgi:hypothetical protein